MLSENQINQSFLEVFNSMEEGIEYRFWPKIFENTNIQRQKLGYSKILPFTFTKKKYSLVFDWLDNGWSKTTVKIEKENTAISFAFAFAFASVAFAFSLAFAFALAENQIEKAKPETCDGKEVLIEGKTYILKLKA